MVAAEPSGPNRSPACHPELQQYLSTATWDELLDQAIYAPQGDIAMHLADASADPRLFAETQLAILSVIFSKGRQQAAAAGSGGAWQVVRLLDRGPLALLHGLSRGHVVPCRRSSIPEGAILSCLKKLERVTGAPNFYIDVWGAAISLHARPGSPFLWHLDHLLPVSCGGLNEESNLFAIHAGINLKKGDRYVDRVLHRQQLLDSVEPCRIVTKAQVEALVAELHSQGKEASYMNVMDLMQSRAPWQGQLPSNAGSSRSTSAAAARLDRDRTVRGWTAEQEEELLRAVTYQLALSGLMPSDRIDASSASTINTRRINWAQVAARVDSGHTNEQCKEKWRRMVQHSRPQQQLQEQQDREEQEPAEVETSPRWQQRCWSEAETLKCGELLEQLARMLAGKGADDLLRDVSRKLKNACEARFGEGLEAAFPGRRPREVQDKCRNIVETAVKLALGQIANLEQTPSFTPQLWRQVAPGILPVPPGSGTSNLVDLLLVNRRGKRQQLKSRALSAEGQRKIWEFALRPEGVKADLPGLEDYQPGLAARAPGDLAGTCSSYSPLAADQVACPSAACERPESSSDLDSSSRGRASSGTAGNSCLADGGRRGSSSSSGASCGNRRPFAQRQPQQDGEQLLTARLAALQVSCSSSSSQCEVVDLTADSPPPAVSSLRRGCAGTSAVHGSMLRSYRAGSAAARSGHGMPVDVIDLT